MDVGASVEASCHRSKWRGLCHPKLHRLGVPGLVPDRPLMSSWVLACSSQGRHQVAPGIANHSFRVQRASFPPLGTVRGQRAQRWSPPSPLIVNSIDRTLKVQILNFRGMQKHRGPEHITSSL